jgi:hypothetical protein
MLRSAVKPSWMHAGWIMAGALLVANAGSAEAALVLSQPTLRASPAHRQQVRLACDKQRCLTLRVSQRWLTAARLLGGSTLVPAAVASLATAGPGAAIAPLAAPAVSPPSVGAHIALRAGRELELQLTPTPARCAPLLSLRY